MQVLNCLIVEDEPLAADIIADYVRQVPGLKLGSICGDVFAANEAMRSQAIDLVFLDINLPGMSGLELIRSSQRRCQFILTTAYHQHAVEGFNLNVVDYLLKPIEFSRFLQAVNKVYERLRSAPKTPQPAAEIQAPASNGAAPAYYFFKVDKKRVKVMVGDIRYIESLKDYIRIHTQDGALVTKFSISDVEKLLGNAFLRIHKSYAVQLGHIQAYSATDIEIGGKTLPIGRTYRKVVEKVLCGLENGN